MIKFFSDYIKNIAICIIFIAFVEMLLPNNSFKKYVDIVLGFIIIIIVLSPFKNFLFKDSKSFEIEVFSKKSQLENYMLLKEKDIYENKQKDLILESYKKNLNQQINELINKNMVLNIKSINIDIENNSESTDFSQIKRIEVYADENTNFNKDKPLYIKPIEKVSIKENSTDVYIESSNRNYELETDLQSLIANFYELNQSDVYVIINKS